MVARREDSRRATSLGAEAGVVPTVRAQRHGRATGEEGMFNFISHIERNPNIHGGKPYIKGTQILVEEILQRLQDGEKWEQIFARYPQLTEQDMYAALFYAGYTEAKAQG
jgi:uncharacterized protein (DUF433 family)